MPQVLSLRTRYAIETGFFRSDRPSYTCPLCGSDGCIDAFPPESAITLEAGAKEFRHKLHPVCVESAQRDMWIVIPFGGFDAPYIELRSRG